MRLQGEFIGKAKPEDARARLVDPARWSWLGGLVESAPNGCRVAFEDPLPVTLRLELTPVEEGVQLRLIEGDLTDLSGTVEISKYRRGCRVRATIDLTFPVSVPGTLLRQLDQAVFPRWGQALADPV